MTYALTNDLGTALKLLLNEHVQVAVILADAMLCSSRRGSALRRVSGSGAVTDAQHVEGVRAAIVASLELLWESRPDTFLGRKSQEPFPSEHENSPVTTESNDTAVSGSIDVRLNQ